ncbi:MAG: protease inhibitor I42 family protein [Candidatus Competibacteraceae bacterium]
MQGFGPRALTPGDGRDWLIQAAQLIGRQLWLFIAVALLAPAGTALLLALPIWDWWLPALGAWITLIATIFCYGLPLSFTVALACGLARAANRKQAPSARQLFNWTAIKALTRTTLLLFLLVLQGYLVVYWVQDQLLPVDLAAVEGGAPVLSSVTFGIASTVLGTQLSVLGSVVLVLQVLLAWFAIPLQLFRELPLAVCWQRSALAMQLNPWLFPVLGLSGLTLAALPFLDLVSIPAQVLALPLPVYLGALLYVAWNDVFQGGVEEEEFAELQDLWRAGVSSEPMPRQSGVRQESGLHPKVSPLFNRALLILTLVLLTACAAKSASPNTSPAGVRENGLMVLTRTDHNRTAEIRVGERIAVRLAENPATGFSWAIHETNRRLLTLDGSDYVAPESGFIGAKGQRTFQFTARQPGEITLQLKYWRVWEGDGSVTERFTVTLRIVP